MSITRYYRADDVHRPEAAIALFNRVMEAEPFRIQPSNAVQVINLPRGAGTPSIRLYVHMNERAHGHLFRVCRFEVAVLGMPGPHGFMEGVEALSLPVDKDAIYFDAQAPLPAWLEGTVIGHILPRVCAAEE